MDSGMENGVQNGARSGAGSGAEKELTSGTGCAAGAGPAAGAGAGRGAGARSGSRDGSGGGGPLRRAVLSRRTPAGAVVACLVLGGALVVMPDEGRRTPPAPGPVARAAGAVGAGTPAALPDLVALIADREAHLRAHPGDARSWAELGTAYVQRAGRTAEPRFYPKAEAALRRSLKSRPKGNAEALLGLTVLANARHDFRAGRKWGRAAVAAAPKRWTAYPPLIDAYRGAGDHKRARKALARLDALPAGGRASRGRVLTAAGLVHRDRGWREDSAAALWDAAALASAPAERADCLVRAGELALERGEPAEALRAFDAALPAEPGEHAARAGRGRALAALGRHSEALRAYQSALATRPLPRYALELGELYEALGVDGAARAQYDVVREQVRQGRAGGVNDELVLGLLEADHGGDRGARSAVRRLRAEWARHPSAPVADALGWALHRAGKQREAIRFAVKATDRVRGGTARVALYSFHRGMIERESGRDGAARRHLEEALRIDPAFSPLLVPVALDALDSLDGV